MGHKRTAGLIKRGGVWHIDKPIRGSQRCESTGESDLKQAEAYLAKRTEELRQAAVYGIRPKRSFRLAATKYLNENQDKRRIADMALHLKQLDPFIGSLPLDGVHMGTLRPFIEARRQQGVKTKSINMALGVVRHVLNLAASESDVAAIAAEDQAAAGERCASALPTLVGRANATVRGTAEAPGANGAFQGQHGTAG